MGLQNCWAYVARQYVRQKILKRQSVFRDQTNRGLELVMHFVHMLVQPFRVQQTMSDVEEHLVHGKMEPKLNENSPE